MVVDVDVTLTMNTNVSTCELISVKIELILCNQFSIHSLSEIISLVSMVSLDHRRALPLLLVENTGTGVECFSK